MTVTIKLLDEKTIPHIMSAFLDSEWKTPEAYYRGLLEA
jgi:hypothetical protein